MNTYYIFFSKLANPLRMSILSSLKNKEKSVNELSNELNVEQSKLSHALQSLKVCNLVQVKKSGKNRIYNINRSTILPMLKLVDKHEKKFCIKCWAKKIK